MVGKLEFEEDPQFIATEYDFNSFHFQEANDAQT